MMGRRFPLRRVDTPGGTTESPAPGGKRSFVFQNRREIVENSSLPFLTGSTVGFPVCRREVGIGRLLNLIGSVFQKGKVRLGAGPLVCV